jgi:hypothetical protein
MLLTALTGSVLWNSIQTHSVQTLRDQLDSWRPLFAGIRWTLIGSVALGWPVLCRCLVRSCYPGNSKTRQLIDLRWRVVGWLLVIELILGQNVLVKLMTLMVSKAG